LIFFTDKNVTLLGNSEMAVMLRWKWLSAFCTSKTEFSTAATFESFWQAVVTLKCSCRQGEQKKYNIFGDTI